MSGMGRGLLALLRLASPALPVGGFSYSEGLEAAIDQGWVRDEASCTQWLCDLLLVSQARGDLALLAQAMVAWQAHDVPRLQALADWLHHSRESSEMRRQSEQMGRSMTDWLRQRGVRHPQALQTLAHLPPHYVMAYALALADSVLEATPQPLSWDDWRQHPALHDALSTYAFAWAENMTQAALKAVPLGQASGQRMLQALMDRIELAVATALATADEDRQAFAPMWAILSAQHEVQYSRLFRS